ncbi:MAG: ADOP family duplicated permease [Acidobacteria bacterium]|nr:ADOP family duplicated permease [Acidobacteriota bacterium]
MRQTCRRRPGRITAQGHTGCDRVAGEIRRDARATRWLDETWQDLRFSLRALRATPGVTTVVILSLALGIGASTAIFSLVNGLLLRSLPVPDANRLVTLGVGNTGQRFTYATFEELRRHDHLFDGALAWAESALTIGEEAEPAYVQWVSGDFFDTLGARAFAGRTFTRADDVAGGGPEGPVAVISHGLWQRRFGGASDAIGRSLLVEGVAVTVVGVAPPGFHGVLVGSAFDLLLPVRINDLIRPTTPRTFHAPWLRILLRLRPGQSVGALTAALQAAQPQIRSRSHPPGPMGDAFLGEPFVVESAARGVSDLRRRYAAPLVTLLAVVSLVLLVACTNVANILLGRGAARRHALSLQVALGASRGRLVRRFLIESALLALLGAVLGILFAGWAARAMVAQLPSGEVPIVLDLDVDLRVLAYTASVAVAAALVAGLAPALWATTVHPLDALKADGRSGGGRVHGFSALQVAQVAVSVLLLVAAGLFGRTFQQLTRAPLGFDDDRLLVATVRTPTTPPAEQSEVRHRLARAVASIPGVAAAGGSDQAPLYTTYPAFPLSLSGVSPLPAAEASTHMVPITPGWFEAYGMPMRAGRPIEERDAAGAQPVMVVNDEFVERFLPGQDLLGRTVAMTFTFPDGEFTFAPKAVVGIVGNAVHESIRGPVHPIVYVPMSQEPLQSIFVAGIFIAVRSEHASPGRLGRSVATTLAGVDPDVRVSFLTGTGIVDFALARDRLVARLAAFAGALALLLTALGVGGVTAYHATRRRPELAVRAALGSTRGRLVGLVLSRVLQRVVAGVVVGLGFALWTSRLAESMLFGIEPRDPVVFAGAALTIAVVGLLAGWVPAHRASRLHPARTLTETRS